MLLAVIWKQKAQISTHIWGRRVFKGMCSMKKGVLRNFAQFTGKHLCQSIFLNKLAASDYKFIKKETLAQVFCCELRVISKNAFCIEDLPMTVSVVSKEFYKIFRISFSRKNINDSFQAWQFS